MYSQVCTSWRSSSDARARQGQHLLISHIDCRSALQVAAAILSVDSSGALPVYVIGHSLGAAVAMVTAAMLQGNAASNAVKGVLTYGGPRVGDSSWATAYDSLGLSQLTLRYVQA